MDVGLKIKAYMDERNISQVELSTKTGIPTCKLNLSLSAKRRFTFTEYQCICWALGVGVDQFMSPLSPAEVGA